MLFSRTAETGISSLAGHRFNLVYLTPANIFNSVEQDLCQPHSGFNVKRFLTHVVDAHEQLPGVPVVNDSLIDEQVVLSKAAAATGDTRIQKRRHVNLHIGVDVSGFTGFNVAWAANLQVPPSIS